MTIEPGAIYQDHNGQQREAVKVLTHLVKFRLVSHGKGKRELRINPGETRWMGINDFKEWAQGEAA